MSQSLPATRRPGASPDVWAWTGSAGVALIASALLTLAYAIRHSQWLVDAAGRPLAHDFACFWAAGRVALQGHASAAYHWESLHAVLAARHAVGFDHRAVPFMYPPFVLLLLAPLSALPYMVAAAAWLAGGWLLYMGGMALATRRGAMWLAAAAAPAAMESVWYGQNGLLVAGLLAAGLALIPRRPILAGVLIGLLACKPQFGVLLPVALVAGRHWRTFAAAAATVAGLVVAGWLAFGAASYGAFLQTLTPGHGHFGALGELPAAQLQSVYGLLLFAGAPASLAAAGQAGASVAALAAVALLWRSDRSHASKAAGLAALVLVASPYCGIYDLAVTLPAIAFMAGTPEARGTWRTAALAGAYAVPMIHSHVDLPLGPVVCALLAAVVWLPRAAAAPALTSPRLPARQRSFWNSIRTSP